MENKNKIKTIINHIIDYIWVLLFLLSLILIGFILQTFEILEFFSTVLSKMFPFLYMYILPLLFLFLIEHFEKRYSNMWLFGIKVFYTVICLFYYYCVICIELETFITKTHN